MGLFASESDVLPCRLLQLDPAGLESQWIARFQFYTYKQLAWVWIMIVSGILQFVQGTFEMPVTQALEGHLSLWNTSICVQKQAKILPRGPICRSS